MWKYKDIEYKSNSDRNKTISFEEHLNKIRITLYGLYPISYTTFRLLG